MRVLLPSAAALMVVSHAYPALAQRDYGGAQTTQQRELPKEEKKKEATPTLAAGNLKVSKEAFKALNELRIAVEANDLPNIPARIAAAQAVVKSPADRFILGQLQLQAAQAAKDEPAMAAALQAMLDTGVTPPGQKALFSRTLAKLHFNAKRYDAAAAALEQALAENPSDSDAIALLAETRNSQNRPADAVSLLQKGIQIQAAAGQKAPDGWYRRAVALAYGAKLPVALELSRQWLTAYPTATNWGDALKVYRGMQQRDEATTLDALRLARAAGAFGSEADYHLYAFDAVNAGAIGEAKAVIDEAIAAKKIDPNKAIFKEIAQVVKEKIGQNDPALLADSAKAALSGPNARLALRTADALYGIGDYAKAAELYRAALGKTGADANLLNLRLGMALARAGDKAGATAAFNAAGGAQAELAKYWLIWLSTRS